MMYDVAIVGAGPAGATLARLIGGHRKVLLIDRREFGAGPSGPGPAKCCGGLLAPDAQKMLARLELGLPKEVLVEPQLFSVRTLDRDNGLERHYQRHYINIDRGKFDRWLVRMLPAAVERRFGWGLRTLGRSGGGFDLGISRDGRAVTERARVVVGADGAGSLVRRQIAPAGPAPRAYIAIQEWFETAEAMPYYSAVFDRRITDFYSWTIPKEGQLIVGSALSPGAGAPAKFERLKRDLQSVGFRLGRRTRREGALILRPAGSGRLCLGRGRAVLIGEAAGLISPSSGEGISYALASAEILSGVLSDEPADLARRYRTAARSLRRSIAAKAVKNRILYDPRLRRLLIASGLGAIRVGDAPRTRSLAELLTPQAGEIL